MSTGMVGAVIFSSRMMALWRSCTRVPSGRTHSPTLCEAMALALIQRTRPMHDGIALSPPLNMGWPKPATLPVPSAYVVVPRAISDTSPRASSTPRPPPLTKCAGALGSWTSPPPPWMASKPRGARSLRIAAAAWSLMPPMSSGVAAGFIPLAESAGGPRRDASWRACSTRSYVPGAPSKFSSEACAGRMGLAGRVVPGKGAPRSMGQKPAGMGRRISCNMRSMGVTPATGSISNSARLYEYAPARRPSR